MKLWKSVICSALLLSVVSVQELPGQTTTIRMAFKGFGGVAPLYLGQETGIFKSKD